MDNYDNDEEEQQGEQAVVDRLLGSGNPGMAYYRSNLQDPHMKSTADNDSEEEDLDVKATDYVMLVARNDEDVSHIEVHRLEQFAFLSVCAADMGLCCLY